jgi:TldD protein
MTLDRREFLTSSSAAIAAASVIGAPMRPASSQSFAADPMAKELALLALDEARRLGAEYADVRVGRYRNQFISTRERQVTNVTDTDSLGLGIRTLVAGTWGFAATKTLSRDAAVQAAREAAAISRANHAVGGTAVRLAPAAQQVATWQSPAVIAPWDVAIEDKVGLLLRVNEECLQVPAVQFVSSGMFFVKEEKVFANTDGSVIEQTVIRSWTPMQITAMAPDRSDFQSRGSTVMPMGLGYEYVRESLTPDRARHWAEEAAAKLAAKAVEAGEYDLVLAPSHLWLTIHESIGHPTELDRALGFEANYAGTSFVAPPDRVLHNLKYGPEFMNVRADRRQAGSLAAIGYDDEGVPADEWSIVRDGIFVDYQTTREQVGWISEITGVERSHGCSHADSWSSEQFQRMPNVSLLPGREDLSVADLIAATERGIYIVGDGSFSIDQQRYNFQFGGQVFHEIRDGKVVGQLRDVAYQARTPDFWNAMDMIGGPQSYELGGSFFDGKGQPGQVNAVSHGCPPARFRRINVINTGRRS